MFWNTNLNPIPSSSTILAALTGQNAHRDTSDSDVLRPRPGGTVKEQLVGHGFIH